jgi:hypothetical protein
MQRDAVALTGLKPLLANLDLTSKQIGKLAGDSLEYAAAPLESAISLNAMKILREAEARGYHRRKGRHLYQSVGCRVKYYREGSSVLVAVGPIYNRGGYHSHLVEFGHQIVKGGTLQRSGHIAGLTAAGSRLLKSAGLKKRGSHWMYGEFKLVKGETIKGKKVKIGNTFLGKQIRGGGRVKGTVQGKPFAAPAYAAQRRKVFDLFQLHFKSSLESLVEMMKT